MCPKDPPDPAVLRAPRGAPTRRQTPPEDVPHYSTDRESLVREVTIQTYRSSRPGGQRRDKTETGVRLTHVPSGVVVTASERRSQAQNRKAAFDRLIKRLKALNRRPKKRRRTRRPRAAEERRLSEKSRRSVRKRMRKPPGDDA